MSTSFTPAEIDKLQSYLQGKFANKSISLVKMKGSADSLEVMLAGEFLGVIYKDDDEGEISYDFNMAILDIDLK